MISMPSPGATMSQRLMGTPAVRVSRGPTTARRRGPGNPTQSFGRTSCNRDGDGVRGTAEVDRPAHCPVDNHVCRLLECRCDLRGLAPAIRCRAQAPWAVARYARTRRLHRL